MIQVPHSASEGALRPTAGRSGEIRWNLLDAAHFLLRWKRLILLITFFSSVAAIGLVLVLPESYVGKIVLMPPEDRAEGISKMMRSIPLSKLGGGASLLSGIQGGKDLENIYLAILTSKTMRMEMVKEFGLVHLYKFDKRKKFYIEDVLRMLDENISLQIADEGTFWIMVEDESPKRAADMANFMAMKLNDIYKQLTTETQRNQRIFLGERLDLIKADLEKAEEAYTDFQKRNKMLDITEQARVTIDAGSEVEARYLAAELKLDITRRVYSADNPKVKELEMELRELKRQRESFSNQRRSDLLIPYNMAPGLGLELVRLKRNLKIQETLFELVIQQYEFAKFEESKSTPSVQVLDKAEPPQKRASPKRMKIVVAVFFTSLIFGALLGAIIEVFRKFRQTNPEEYANFRRLKEAVFSWKFLLP